MNKEKKAHGELASITLDLIDLILLEEPEDQGTELSADQNPLLNEFRSLAKIQFILCHSLPTVNSNLASWTYPTLINSYKTVKNQVVNLNHELKDNAKVLKIRVGNNIIGHMIDASIQELEQDDNGNFPLVPTKSVPIIATAYLYKRVVPQLIEKLKRGEKVKVSMECEFTEMGFLFEGEFFTRSEKPEFVGKRDYNGKPVVRVLGGIDPKGGVVNFWGCAILDNQKPADEGAEVLSAVATEIGENPSDFINLINEEEIDMKDFLQRLTKETAAILGPLLETQNIADITDENIAQALIAQLEKVKQLEVQVEGLLNEKPVEEVVVSDETEEASIPGSLEEHIDLVRERFRNKLIEADKCTDQATIRGILASSVIIDDWIKDTGYESYQVDYAVTDSGEILFGSKTKVNIRYVEIVEPAVDDDGPDGDGDQDDTASDLNSQGDSPTMATKKKEVATKTEEVLETPAVENEEVVVENEEAAEEIAGLKTRIQELTDLNKELQDKITAFEQEKEEASRQAVLASRKNTLAEDFDLEDLLEEDDELNISTMSEEEFTSYAAKLKKIAAKSKKGGKTIDPGDSEQPPVGGGKPHKSPSGGPIDLNVKNDVIGPGDNKDKATEETPVVETATKKQPVMPASFEMPVNKDLKSKFGKF